MKTKSKTPTCSASNAHDGQTAADSKKKYEVTLIRYEQSSVTTIIEAATPDEAHYKADKWRFVEFHDWSSYNDDIFVESVIPVEGGQSHE